MKPVHVNSKLPFLWHGGDYNPDQWLDSPEILKEDLRLMKLAKCNVMSVGIFTWSALEPEESIYNFEWLDRLFDEFERNGLYIDLATPSGARPPWLAKKYPEVLRVDAERRRRLFGSRHNHCFTSPVYREKVSKIDEALAKRYAKRKALVLWHISNEFSGDCHCELCQAAFRKFLKERYGSLDNLNKAWWTAFWSHTYTDWEQIESPSPLGELRLHGLNIDWKRFITHQTMDFIRNELASIRKFSSDVPVTTNMMGVQPIELNLQKTSEILDVASWDSYPSWHSPSGDLETAQFTAMLHDLTRSFRRGRPFLLMESTPSVTNWQCVPKLKRPGMHKLSSILAVASGSDSVMYFQWRKSRGGSEKFHGAVIGHEGHENTRTFMDVSEVGTYLERLSPVAGSLVDAKVGIIGDWENWWGVDDCKALHKERKDYWSYVSRHHKPFFKMGVATDIVSEDADLETYKLVAAPMLYMVKPGFAERLEKFVSKGGVLILTFWSGLVDERDLCFLGGAPGPLRQLAGLWAEELDCLYEADSNAIVPLKGNALGLSGRYEVNTYCERIHPETAKALAVYGSDYYKGTPALTVNSFGEGRVYYVAANAGDDFLSEFYSRIVSDLKLQLTAPLTLPEGVVVRRRTGDRKEFLFIMNFNPTAKEIYIKEPGWTCLENGECLRNGKRKLPSYGVLCLTRETRKAHRK